VSGQRQRRERDGRLAETAAALWLMLKGYRILARRWRSPAGEIDLIARRGGTIAFIEVKRRATAEGAAEAITPRQRDRIARAAAAFLAARPALSGLDARFDAVLIAPRRIPRHLRDAWRD
jgi:putative endonuclease